MYSYDELKDFVCGCKGCPLSLTRKNAVMGKGEARRGIMLVAEAPGGNEDRDGVPFTGRSGGVLDEVLQGAGLTRDDVYITNIVKCHPPRNRDPLPEEQERCMEYLRHEFTIVRPRIVVCLGRVAAQKIIDKNYRITRQHGEIMYKMGTPFTATFHPSAALRDPGRKDEMRDDFAKILKEIEG